MSLKRNIAYNGLLTAGLYICQLITYPYVTRVLGVHNLGMCNFVQSFVYLFTLMASLGIGTLGVREIAKANGDKQKTYNVFTELFTLLCLLTIVSTAIYVIAVLTVPELQQYKRLLCIGLLNIIAYLFQVTWFFRGVEDFQYITLRTLAIRIVYIILIFLLIRKPDDYITYYQMTVGSEVVTALINWNYKGRYVHLVRIRIKVCFKYLKPLLLLGLQFLLLQYYNVFSPILLGFLGDNTQVGFYTVATKLVLIILNLYNAYTLVMLPRVSSLIGKGKDNQAEEAISKSFSLIYIVAIPLVAFTEICTPEIVALVAGKGYEGAVLPMRICSVVVLFGGITQITINQILIPHDCDAQATKASAIGFLSSIIINIVLIPIIGSVASAVAWIVPEFLIAVISLHYAKRCFHNLNTNNGKLIKLMLLTIPVFGLVVVKNLINNVVLGPAMVLLIIAVYYHLIFSKVMKESLYMQIYDDIRGKIKIATRKIKQKE